MSSSSDTLHFHFPANGDSILSKMNALREEHRFCDVTLLLGGSRGATVQPPHFHGHRVVLAASSDFLRDQFLLHEGRAELTVGVPTSVEVGKRLLLSCYTGLLEVPLRELVSYLTAASVLQMSQVVEKCAQAVSQYFSPTLASLKLEKSSKEQEIQQPDGLKNQVERNAAQSSSSIQEACSKEGRAVVIESKSRISQGGKLNGQGLREVKDDKRVVTAKIELTEDAGHCLESEEGGEIHPKHTNKPSCHDKHIKGALRWKPRPHTAIRNHVSSLSRGVFSQHGELVDTSQNPDEEARRQQKEEEDRFFLAAQLQKCGELIDSHLYSGTHLPKSHCSGDELTEDSNSTLVQKPYLCRRCDKVFQQLEGYVGHLKEHRQYLCLVCGRGFSQKSNLTHHIRIHSGFKCFRCPLCHKTFFQKATLQHHLNLHTGDKPHKCNYCAVHFTHMQGLRRHLKDIHGKSSLQNMLEEAVN